MARYWVAFVAVILLSSCSTIFNRPTQNIEIRSSAVNASVEVNDSVYALPAKIAVRRSNVPLAIEFIHDSIREPYTLQPSVNPKFVFGNLLMLQLSPVAYGIDLTNQNRFYYNRSFTLNPDDTTKIIYTTLARKFRSFSNHFTKKHETNKGQINFGASIPYITGFYMQPKGRGRDATGFIGISATGEYYYRNNRFVALSLTAVSDGDPLMVEYFSDYHTMTSQYIAFTDNFWMRRFTFGYGINYTRNAYTLLKRSPVIDPPIREFVAKKNLIGLSANSYYQISRLFFIGVKYNPAIYNLSAGNWDYEHTISLDVMVKFRLKK